MAGDAVAFEAALRTPAGNWDQGDIVDGVYFPGADGLIPGVLITPACDIEHDKVDLWTFVALFSDAEIAYGIVRDVIASWGSGDLSEKQRKTLGKHMHDLIAQRLPRYHWLPVGIGRNAAHVADFSWVTSLPAAEVRKNAQRLASLSSSWREQLPARYVAYMGRVGTDDFREGDVAAAVERLVAHAETARRTAATPIEK